MEGSSFQMQADCTNCDGEKNQILTTSLKINVQTLRVSSGNTNSTDDTAMSGFEYAMAGIANSLASKKNSKPHSSINTGEIQQQVDMARILQLTIRALQPATDKAINKCAKRNGIQGAEAKPRAKRTSRSHQKLLGNDKVTLSNHLGNRTVTAPNSKLKKKKKKKKNGAEQRGDPCRERLTRRLKSDALMTSNAQKAAKKTVDKFKDIHDQAPNPREWQTLYEQEYQARTAVLRARQLRDEQALLSALDGLSLGGSKSTGDDYDSIL
ncbi:hypothetical protein EYC80_004438 [Monilinia laxa]|uniref:Uncharacterized protein n=1 Tax=Monilinia laxa TaxID=61186 RepID=A0A5N6KMS0_MONLA|nr:hypothetical protein EYC80_004438 [Monilinia laxa]